MGHRGRKRQEARDRPPQTDAVALPAAQGSAAAGPLDPGWWPVIALVLIELLVVAVYAPVLGYGFLNYDDPLFVADNPHVLAGVSWSGLVWSVTEAPRATANFQPVTVFTYMLDVSLFGPRPEAMHRTNLLWHLLNVWLVERVLRTLTGRPWPSVIAAGVFGLHPLNVQAVAWISERKGLVSTGCGLLAVWWYLRTVQRQRAAVAAPGVARIPTLTMLGIAAVLATSLLAKQMLVLVPVVLLILDEWPLGRWSAGTRLHNLILEKWPLFAAGLLFAVATILAQSSAGAIRAGEQFPLSIRLASATQAYWISLGHLVWPVDLAMYYPHPQGGTSLLMGLIAGVGLVAVTTCSWVVRQREPLLFAGWMWFGVLLFPVSGVVQLAFGWAPDRYVYVPSIGVIWATVWLLNRWLRWTVPRIAVLAAWGVFAAALTSSHVQHWRNLEALCRQAISVSARNEMAEYMLAEELAAQSRFAEATEHFRRACEIVPDWSAAWHGLGSALFAEGKISEAVAAFTRSLELEPDSVVTLSRLGVCRRMLGEADAARSFAEQALRLDPDYPPVLFLMGLLELDAAQPAAAVPWLRRAIQGNPDWIEARQLLEQAEAAVH